MKKRIQWTPDAEEVLINIWAEKFEELKTRPNSHVRDEIVSILDSHGYPFSSNEVRIKIHNLSNRYRVERKKIALSGGVASSSWPCYDKVHTILGKYKNYEFEIDNSTCKSEVSTEFAFVQSDSLQENQLFSEDDSSDNSEKSENLVAQRNAIIKQNSIVAASLKRNFSGVTTENVIPTISKKVKINEASSSSNCLNKLAKTVDDVVNFVMKTENNKSRNESFLKVLDSYLLKLPEKTQDGLKIELLNTVFNKIKADEGIVKDA